MNTEMNHAGTIATLPALFGSQAAATPHAVALIDGDARLTYAALEARSSRIAHLLLRRGMVPGDIVAVALPRRFDFVATLLGIAKAGGAYLAIDPALPAERLRYLFDASAVRLVVSDPATAPRLPDGSPAVLMLDDAALASLPESSPDTAPTPEDIAYVTFTSGSTGRPKGSLIPHRAIPGFFRGNPLIDAGPGEVWLQHSSILWDALTLELWPALLSGGAVALLPDLRPTLDVLADALVDYQVTTVWLGASLFNALIDEAADALASVRCCLVGGEALSIPHCQRAQQTLPGMRIVNGYGPSECTVFATCHPLPQPLPEGLRSVPIGRPVGDRLVHLLDRSMQRVPVGVPGEICIGGPAVAHGYLDEPGLTATAFVPDPFGPPGSRLYRTGDFGRWQPGGTIEFMGRRDLQVKIRGYRVETAEIAERIKAHPAVRDAVCIMRPGAGDDTRLIAYVVPQETADHAVLTQQVTGWQRIFDERVYTAASTAADPSFNTTGWQSSFDGSDIPTEQMRVWADDIIAQVRALAPRDVLEIGCGSGMLTLQLASGCDSYTGTDISGPALDYVREQAGTALRQLRLLQQPAHDWSGIEPASVDLILLSSVVQYFPSVDYLVGVLDASRRALRPGGSIVLADLRSFPLARCLATAIEWSQAGAGTTAEALRARIEQRLAQSAELLVDPALFPALRGVLPEFTTLRTRVQRGRVANELNGFRYSVVMTASGASADAEPLHLASPALETIAAELAEGTPHVLVTDLPNRRLASHWQRLQRLAALAPGDALPNIAEPEAIDPEDLHALAERHGYRIELGWSDRDPSRLDASFARTGEPAALPVTRPRSARAGWQSYANQPRQAVAGAPLIATLRQDLAAALPDYMMPRAFVLLDRIPLTANGKLDRNALPPPPEEAGRGGAEAVPPRDALETVLAQFYAELLQIRDVSVHDGFFNLGGHSLLVTQLASRIRKTFRIDLPLRVLFEQSTVAELAKAIAGRDERLGQAERIAAIYLKVTAMSADEVTAQHEQIGA